MPIYCKSIGRKENRLKHKLNPMNNIRQKIVLFPITIEELENIIKEGIKSEMQKTITKVKQEDVLLSRHETAKLLNISLGTLNKFCKDGTVVSYRMGSSVRFKKDEVIGCLKQMKSLKYNRN